MPSAKPILICLALLATTSSAKAAATFSTLHGSKPVSADTVPATLATSCVLVRLGAGDTFELYDLHLKADGPSEAMIAVSSEYITVAVITGKIESVNASAKAGEAMIWSHDGTMHKPTVQAFAAKELAARWHSAGDVDAGAVKDASALADHQQARRTWGLLRATNVNVGMPLAPTAETLRREYIAQPEVVNSRREARSESQVPDDVARRAVEAIKAGRADDLAQLLTPVYFRNAAADGKLADARLGMAKDIVNLPWAKDADAATLKHAMLKKRPTTQPTLSTTYTFTAGDRTILLDVGGFDSAAFVTRISDSAAATPPTTMP